MKQHRKKTKHKKDHPIALAWYSREQWELLRQVAADADGMEETYEQWEDNAGNAYRILYRSGYVVETVDVDVPELLRWCKSRNRPLNSEARSDYIEEKLEDRRRKK
ncbi:MAG: hypothetical protein K9J79_03125 [Desulfobacteraceae bacterium]|nr:hypothetical protein [Desulfobacteraceae bacterium]